MITDSAPPADHEAEEAVLGAVLKSAAAFAAVSWLAPDDFHQLRHQAVWQGMLDLSARNVPVDYTTLAAALKHRGTYEQVGGLAALSEISLSPTAAHVEHYARLVADAATQRRYVEAAQRIAEAAWPIGVDVQELSARAEALLAGARPSQGRSELLEPQRWAEAFWSDLEARASGVRTAVSTGLVDIDNMTLGLEAGGLYLLMAAPGVGKSELALEIAMHVARVHGPVLFASLEMSSLELAHRFARISRGLDRNNLAKGRLTPDEYTAVAEAMNDMATSRFWPAAPTSYYTTADLRSDALQVRAKGGHVALIVADYLQRFKDRETKTSSREENVGLVAQNLKWLAREFGCPVLAPCQPNRDHVGRSNKRPLLSDLRESGKLEQEADVVLGLYRDEKHDDHTRDRGVAEVHMLKNRSGAGDADGSRKIVWRGSRYENFAASSAAPYWAA